MRMVGGFFILYLNRLLSFALQVMVMNSNKDSTLLCSDMGLLLLQASLKIDGT